MSESHTAPNRAAGCLRDQLAEVDHRSNAWAHPAATPGPDYKTTYSYDNLGNLNRMTRASGDTSYERATDYVYDGSRQLRQEVQYPSWPLTTPTLTTTYAYDGNGNRTSLVDPLSLTTSFALILGRNWPAPGKPRCRRDPKSCRS